MHIFRLKMSIKKKDNNNYMMLSNKVFCALLLSLCLGPLKLLLKQHKCDINFWFHAGGFGTKCAGCAQGISPNDLVRKARSKVFHLKLLHLHGV